MSELYLDLTASFSDVTNPTPFGIYDLNTDFQTFCDGLVEYSYSKLGGNILQVEIINKDIYTCAEEAVLEYSAMINSYQAKSVIADIIGSPTGSLSGKEQKLPHSNLGLTKRKASGYSSEAIVGGERKLLSASIDLKVGQQNYNLRTILSSSGVITDNQYVEIKDVFHFSPTAAYRFFDTTSAVNYLHNQFNFESFTPETIFYLLPIWEDVLRAQTLEQSHRIRRSNYSWNIVGNELKLYPTPTADAKLHFTYYHAATDPYDINNDPYVDGVSNLSNVPFGDISFDKLNSVGKQWIRRFAMSLVKEVLGQVRNKVSTVPIPNGDLSLNGGDLIAEARDEQQFLRQELRDLLESMTYDRLIQQEQEQSENIMRQLKNVPMGIFIG